MSTISPWQRIARLRFLPRDLFAKLDLIIATVRSTDEKTKCTFQGLSKRLSDVEGLRELVKQVAELQDDVVRRSIAERRVSSDIAELENSISVRTGTLAAEIKHSNASMLDALRAVEVVMERQTSVLSWMESNRAIQRYSFKGGRASAAGWNGPPLEQKRYSSERPLAFFHVPKSAGASMKVGLERALNADKVVFGFDRVLFGSFNDFDAMAPTERRYIYMDPDEIPRGADYVAGHFAASTLFEAYPDAQLLTIAREPISRLLSHWLYWRAVPNEALTPLGSWASVVKTARSSLADFLLERRAACQTDNIMTRMLLWPHPVIPADDFIAPEQDDVLVSAAMRTLERFSFVDAVGNPNLEFQLSNWLGQPVVHARENVTEHIPAGLKEPLQLHLTPEAFALLVARTRLDSQLWSRIVSTVMPEVDVGHLQAQTIAQTVARHALLMA